MGLIQGCILDLAKAKSASSVSSLPTSECPKWALALQPVIEEITETGIEIVRIGCLFFLKKQTHFY